MGYPDHLLAGTEVVLSDERPSAAYRRDDGLRCFAAGRAPS